MDNEKVIVTLLLIAILLSVVTLAITLSVDVPTGVDLSSADFVDAGSANVQLEILPTSANSGAS